MLNIITCASIVIKEGFLCDGYCVERHCACFYSVKGVERFMSYNNLIIEKKNLLGL